MTDPIKCNANLDCQNAAQFAVTAAYPVGPLEMGHEGLGRYPSPMAHSCGGCLPDFMLHDQTHPGATSGYYVMPLP